MCVSGCKSTITCFWFAVLARPMQFSFLFLQIDTHNICLPLGAVCKSNLFWRCAAFTGRTIHSFPLALPFFDNRAYIYCKPPPPRRPPNLHSRFYECGNLSRDTAEIRLGNSAGIVLDMVLVAPIWGRGTAIWTLGTRHQRLSVRVTGPWPSPVPRASGGGAVGFKTLKKLQQITIIY